MRTTLAIDDDVLTAAKAIAQKQHISVGKVVSDLARRALHHPGAPVSRNGVPLLPASNWQAMVTFATVKALHDALP